MLKNRIFNIKKSLFNIQKSGLLFFNIKKYGEYLILKNGTLAPPIGDKEKTNRCGSGLLTFRTDPLPEKVTPIGDKENIKPVKEWTINVSD